MNVEYHFLLGGPFRLVAFADAGKVFGGCGIQAREDGGAPAVPLVPAVCDESLSLDNFRYSAGLELQVNVPILGAPLRFIYSRNLDPLLFDRFETFQFSIGPSF